MVSSPYNYKEYMKGRLLIIACILTGIVMNSCQDLKLGDAFLEKAPSSEVDINTI